MQELSPGARVLMDAVIASTLLETAAPALYHRATGSGLAHAAELRVRWRKR